MLSFFDAIQDWIVTFFRDQHLLGPLLLLILEEAGIPMPIPGDIFIAYIGYQVSQGRIDYFQAVIGLVLAVLVGSSILYFLARRFGEPIVLRIGKYAHINKKKLLFIERKFRQYGPLVIIVGRHVPGFRIPITVFSGISKVDYKVFLMSEFISIIFWIFLFMQLGARLGRKTTLLFHNHYSFLALLIIPVSLTIISFVFGKFIPEEEE